MATPTELFVRGSLITVNFGAGINGLASGSAQQSDAVDFTTLTGLPNSIPNNTLPDDFEIEFWFKTGSGSLASYPVVNWFVEAIGQNSQYPWGLTGANGSFTVPTNGLSPKYAQAVSAATTLYPAAGHRTMRTLMGLEICPKKLVVACQNQTGQASDATAGAGCYITPIFRQFPSY